MRLKTILDCCVLVACVAIVAFTMTAGMVPTSAPTNMPKVDTQNMRQITPERFEMMHVRRG